MRILRSAYGLSLVTALILIACAGCCSATAATGNLRRPERPRYEAVRLEEVPGGWLICNTGAFARNLEMRDGYERQLEAAPWWAPAEPVEAREP